MSLHEGFCIPLFNSIDNFNPSLSFPLKCLEDYFPKEFGRLRFYEPVERGFERDLIKRIAYFDKLRARRRDDR